MFCGPMETGSYLPDPGRIIEIIGLAKIQYILCLDAHSQFSECYENLQLRL